MIVECCVKAYTKLHRQSVSSQQLGTADIAAILGIAKDKEQLQWHQ